MDKKSDNAERRREGERRSVAERRRDLSLHQPKPARAMREMLDLLDSFERIAEQISEDRSGDMGASGAGASRLNDASNRTSGRGKAIRSLPSVPVMRKRLVGHLQKEMRRLERDAKRLARSTKKGSAYLLNELYARIRKIQLLISELADAAADTVKRLYVRMFIDRQKIV